MDDKLLSRDEFRTKCFERDGYKCVICGRSDRPLDAHHIIERRLWEDGGYYLSNAATLCDEGSDGCHYKAETTEISVEQIRESCGIKKFKLPDYMYDDVVYDKWGNTFLKNGMRTIGPLFNDESVQKVLSKYINEFTHYVKYERTFHVPWSDGVNEDDKMLKNMDNFVGKRVVVTEKMDGENTNIYKDYFHARSVDSRHHYTRDWAKSYAMSYISPNLPDGWRICAENMYAKHSIKYVNLDSYLLGFSIWNDKNMCLSWDGTLEWFELLGMVHVKVLYDGVYDEEFIKSLYSYDNYDNMEGYVIRVADSFHYSEFKKNVAKFVRKNHVTTENHWMHGNRNHEINLMKLDVTMSDLIL